MFIGDAEFENYETKRKLLRQHYENLNELELKAAKFGELYTPIYLINQIKDEKKEIARLKAELGYDP